MSLFIIEREFAEEFDLDQLAADQIRLINEAEGIAWLYSFLSADKRKTYCLFEAPSAEAIRRAPAIAGLSVDVVTEVSSRINPDGTEIPIPVA